MTLVAFTVQPNSADIITDTLTYRRNGRSLGATTKVLSLPHLDAAVMTQGGGEFGQQWDYILGSAQDQADSFTFDDLSPLATSLLPELGESLEGVAGHCDSVVFHVGYSPSAGRFKAFGYSSTQGFREVDVSDEMCCMPQPLTEVQRPASVTQWVALAKQLRNERALAPIGLKWFVGGSVHHTRLERGSITQRRVHTFDGSGPEFARMIEGTAHPQAQLADCSCGSGDITEMCHPHAPADAACTCGSGRTYGDCCRVSAEELLVARARKRNAAAGAR